jgi:hypothetical protein
MAAAASSGLSSRTVNSRSTRGRGIIDRVGVLDVALLVVAHPATIRQMPAMTTE